MDARTPPLFDRRFFAALGRLTRPYWTSADARTGWLLFAGILALELGAVFAVVRLSDVQRRIYDALQNKNSDDFFRMLGVFFATADRLPPGVGVQGLRAAGARDSLAALEHRPSHRALALGARLLPARAAPRARRQSRSAHRGRRERLHERRARPLLRPGRVARDARLVRRDPLVALAHVRVHSRRRAATRPGVHGVGGARLRGALDLHHAPRRPQARPDPLRAAALRGRLPLRPRAAARERRSGRAARSRGGRAAGRERALPPRRRQFLAADHRAEEPDARDARLRAGQRDRAAAGRRARRTSRGISRSAT